MSGVFFGRMDRWLRRAGARRHGAGVGATCHVITPDGRVCAAPPRIEFHPRFHLYFILTNVYTKAIMVDTFSIFYDDTFFVLMKCVLGFHSFWVSAYSPPWAHYLFLFSDSCLCQILTSSYFYPATGVFRVGWGLRKHAGITLALDHAPQTAVGVSGVVLIGVSWDWLVAVVVVVGELDWIGAQGS